MSPPDPPPAPLPSTEIVDERVRGLVAAGKHDAATTAALEHYGPELLGFLLALLRSPVEAGDAFSDASIDIWRGLPNFQWQSSLRTWLYVVTRRAAYRVARDPRRSPARALPLSQVSSISRLAVALRDTTLPRLEAQHDALAEIRAQLAPDDQVLLVLRVDRDLPWRDIAEVLEPEGDVDLDAAAARLRKRFMRVKEEIRERARKAGL